MLPAPARNIRILQVPFAVNLFTVFVVQRSKNTTILQLYRLQDVVLLEHEGPHQVVA